jgi:hypothetical protein
MCSYFTIQVLIPIIFALRGAVEAGQMGMSLSITGYMSILALAWSSTKTTPFGRMIARRKFHELDRLFLRTLGQSLAVFGIIALLASGAAVLLAAVAPRLAARMVSPQLFAVLVLAAGANCVIQSLATLLRSFKSEPFLVQSRRIDGAQMGQCGSGYQLSHCYYRHRTADRLRDLRPGTEGISRHKRFAGARRRCGMNSA